MSQRRGIYNQNLQNLGPPVLGLTGIYWTVLGSTGLCLVVQGCWVFALAKLAFITSNKWGWGQRIPRIAGGREGHNFRYFSSVFQPPALRRRGLSVGWASCSTKEGLPFRREHVFPKGQHWALILWWYNCICKLCQLWTNVAVLSDCVGVYSARLNYNKIIAINSSTLSE